MIDIFNLAKDWETSFVMLEQLRNDKRVENMHKTTSNVATVFCILGPDDFV